VGGYLEDINYVDRVLGKFFDKLKQEGLYNDSLIVAYGDHVPVLPAFSAGTIKYDPDTVQGKEVPLFIKLPNQTVGQTHPQKGTHLDIMPTVLDLVGAKTNQLMFGQSLFANDDKALKVCSDQLVTFPNTGNCLDMLQTEKLMSAKIIRYNQFKKITK
jgi:phosphoglycerol transferase MdoB-like AlkP superfamily enzyme